MLPIWLRIHRFGIWMKPACGSLGGRNGCKQGWNLLHTLMAPPQQMVAELQP